MKVKEKMKKWEDTTPEAVTSEENWGEGWEIVDERSAVEVQDLEYLEGMEVKYSFECKKCKTPLELNVSQEYPGIFKTFCPVCYTPLLLDRELNEVKIIDEPIRCLAFFSHSAELEDGKIVEFVEGFLRWWGIDPKSLEIGRGRPSSNVETIKELIKETDITFALITKRYICEANRQFAWKTSEWIQNEIGIAYAYGKPMLALVERGVNIRGILPQITCYYEFERSKMNSPAIPVEFFNRLENAINYVEEARERRVREEEKRKKEARANAVLTLALPLIAAGADAFLGAILGGTVTRK
ncbi:MAG: hypothetical protein ISS94_02385 [Candidatus Syntrophoarchaeum sp.]|nr:hypothetical protein [Candidatus Syntrophoarchaeum sp.]